ncbi:MAG: hypothetical protein AAB728_05525, partial [Patescibacteria group bacterium]
MTSPEQPNTPRAPETREGRNVTAFSDKLAQVRDILGPGQEASPVPYSEAGIDKELEAIVSDNTFESFSEQCRQSELRYRRGALERQALLRDPHQSATVDMTEFVTVNQAVTYHEYLPMVVREVVAVMGRYEALRESVGTVPLEFEQGERQAKLYFTALNAAMRERVAFARILLVEGRLAEGAGNPAELTRRLETYRRSLDLQEESLMALEGSTEEKWRRGNELNQRIIRLLSGTERMAGV